MGMWGFGPLQNDEAHDILDRVKTTEGMINELTQAIVVGYRDCECVGPYMVVGVLLPSLLPDKHKRWVFDNKELYTDIKNRVYNKDTDEKFGVAKSDALVASIPVELRKSLLEAAVKKLKETLANNEFTYDFVKEMKQWYNEASQLIQNNFKDVVNPEVISKEDITWVMKARELYSASEDFLRIREAFPNGALVLTSNGHSYDFIVHSHHKYISGNPVIAPDKPYWYTPFDDRTVLYEKQKHPELKVAQCDAKKAFKTLYPKGFVADKCEDDYYCKLYSLDLNSYILSGSPDEPIEKGEVVKFRPDEIEQIRKVIKVYNSMAEANIKQTAQFHALRKLYDKSGRKIVGYTITDGKSNKNVQVDFLKNVIANKQATFDNLTLTSDNRLVMR